MPDTATPAICDANADEAAGHGFLVALLAGIGRCKACRRPTDVWLCRIRYDQVVRPGGDADEIIARQVAKGNFTSADAVVKARVRMLEEFKADVARLRTRIDEPAYRRRKFRKSPGAEAMKAHIIARGEARSARKS